jgi:hypothetical protein
MKIFEISSENLNWFKSLSSILCHHFKLRTKIRKDYMVVTIYNGSVNVQSFKGMYGPQEIGDHAYFTMNFIRIG